MDNIIMRAVALLVSVGAFLLGKYVFPNVSKSVTGKLRELAAWADKFVVWAREFRKQDSGPEKMEKVVQQLQAVAKEAGWNVTEDQLRAIAQAAYESMMAGAAEAAARNVGVVIIPGQQQEPAQAAQEAAQDAPEDEGGTDTAKAVEATQAAQETPQDGTNA